MRLSHTLFASALALIGTASAQAGTFAATFDGYCDGISVTISNGVAYGTETGCVTGPAVGTRGSVKKQGKAFTLSLAHLPNTIYVLNTENQTWAIYQPDGSMLQSGTYTVGAPLAAGLAQLPMSGKR
ncbi:hypothetical protein KGA65_15380 [Ideonella sp. B7]|uniref:hypothetical protein n=1 Tax=Ideonella benzenivorans TaxID=2831643 RepID=UPI001CEC6FDE|nr:hypothetical protein [Ideonella benzenivorans]MCA6217915.1 hypothetical protein [Ideonella benzenivorans]